MISVRATFCLLTFLGIATPANAVDVTVIDGDTIRIANTTYRLHGIDAPEAGQKCNRNGGGVWRCGKAATKALIELVNGDPVKCDDRGQDSYNRIIAVCTAGGIDLNDTLVRRGYAWAFRTFSSDYVNAENHAHGARLGIWQATTETAEQYRAHRWEIAAQEAPKGCPIKGNISKNGHIYHAPWSPWYKRTKVSINKGERWFCSEREALNAGWRAPIWGK